MLRFLQELLTHFDLNNVHWRPPRSAEGHAWLSTHAEYTAWTEHWNKDSAPSSALFLQCDDPNARRKLTKLAHYLARESLTIRPRSIVAKFSFAEHAVADKRIEAMLAAFAFQILCLQPARFKAVRHMVHGPPGPGQSVSAHLETILKGIVAGTTSKDAAELTLIVDGLDLAAENVSLLVEKLMEIQASAPVALLFTQLVPPCSRYPKGEVVVTNFDYFDSPAQPTTGERARFDLAPIFKNPKLRNRKSFAAATRSKGKTAHYANPLHPRDRTSPLRSSRDSDTSSNDSILRVIPSLLSNPSERQLKIHRSGALSWETDRTRATFRRSDAPSCETTPEKKHRSASEDSGSDKVRSGLEAPAPSPVTENGPPLPASASNDELWDECLARPGLSHFREVLNRSLGRRAGPGLTGQLVALEELLLGTDRAGYNILHLLAEDGRIDIMDELYHKAALHDNSKTCFGYEGSTKLRQQLVEAYTSGGFNALHIATTCRHIAAVRRLCQWGHDCGTPMVDSKTSNKHRETALHLACWKNDVDVVAELLKLGADAEALDGNQRGPILVATKKGSIEILRLLVKHKASLLSWGKSSPLHVAAEVGNMELVGEILSLAADRGIMASKLAGQKDDQGRNPAMLAAQGGHDAVFHRLYQHQHYGKSDVGKDKNGWGTLHFAAEGGSIRILETILKRGVLVFPSGAAGVDGVSPLQIAASRGHEKAVGLLLHSGGQPLAISALHLAATEGIAQRLLTLIELHHQNVNTDSLLRALNNAAKRGLGDMVTRLLKSYPQIFAGGMTVDGSTPIIEAARAGYLEIVRMLVKNDPPADVNLPDGEGQTALLCAAENGQIRVVEYLAELGSTYLESRDARGRTALVAAAVNGHLNVVLVLASGRFWRPQIVDSALCAAAEAGQVDVVGLLLSIAHPFAKHPSLMDITNPETFTALEHAARQGHADVVRVCLQFTHTISNGSLLGAIAHPACLSELLESRFLAPGKIDLRDCRGRTALALAVEQGYYESARLLLKHEANPLTFDMYGRTPLHHAAVVSRAAAPGHKPLLKGELLELLLDYLDDGASIYVQDDNGVTPLLAAVKAGAVYSVRALLRRDGAGALRRHAGHSAFWTAIESGNIDIVLLMVEMLPLLVPSAEILEELVTVAARRNPVMQVVLLRNCHDGWCGMLNPPDWVTDLVANDCTGMIVRHLLELGVADGALPREDEHGWQLMDFAYATDMALTRNKTDAEVSRVANQWFHLPTKFETVLGPGEVHTELREGGNVVRSCGMSPLILYRGRS